VKFQVIPYVGAIPIRFGMSKDEVTAILGQPEKESKTLGGRMVHIYADVNVGYSSEERVNHIGFLPGSELEIAGVDPFGPDGFEKLVEIDGDAVEILGAVVLPNLGVATDGFHTADDESAKGVTIFGRGEYDSVRHRMKSFKLT
jgi:Fe2+ transport system protein FeoA